MRFAAVAVAVLTAFGCAPLHEDPRGLVDRVESAPPEARERLVREAIDRNGGTPLVDGDSALFLVERGLGPAPRLLADFNGWGEAEEQLPETMMTPLNGTSWYYLKRKLDPRARVEYAIARESMDDAALHLDLENPRSVEGFSRSYSELRMPAHPEAPDSRVPPTGL